MGISSVEHWKMLHMTPIGPLGTAAGSRGNSDRIVDTFGLLAAKEVGILLWCLKEKECLCQDLGSMSVLGRFWMIESFVCENL